MTTRSRGGVVAVAGLFLMMLALAACGGGDSASTASVTAAGQPAASEPAASEPAVSEPAASEPAGIADPCVLLDAPTLSSLTGTDNGKGTASGESEVRRFCIYSTGLSTSITRGSEFDPSVAVMRADPNVEGVSDLSGLGERAVMGTYNGGTVRQVIALEGGYFVTVTGTLSEEQATATAAAMLDAL